MAGETSIPYPARATLSEAAVTITSLERVPEIFSLEQEVHFRKGNTGIAAF